MTIARPGFERRVLSALDARPARIPVLVGGCGTGRTFLLRRLRERPDRLPASTSALGHHAQAPCAVLMASPSRRRTSLPRRVAARAFDSLVAFFRARAAAGAGVPVERSYEFRVRELPCRACSRSDRGAFGIDQPLRSDNALHHAGAAVRPRSAEPRGDPPDAAHDRRAARDHRPAHDGRRRARGRARADRRTRRVRPGARRGDAFDRRRSNQRAGGSALRRRAAHTRAHVLVRAAAARALRLRRAGPFPTSWPAGTAH